MRFLLFCALQFHWLLSYHPVNGIAAQRGFNQVGQLRTSSHLQLRPGQDKAKQFDTNNNTELHMEENKHTVNNNTVEK